VTFFDKRLEIEHGVLSLLASGPLFFRSSQAPVKRGPIRVQKRGPHSRGVGQGVWSWLRYAVVSNTVTGLDIAARFAYNFRVNLKVVMNREEIIARLRENEATLRQRGVAHAALFGSRARAIKGPKAMPIS
jgi:hypothetical protein